MPKTKKLGDLFIRGVECTVTDGEDSVEVWIQKLNPLQQDKALRRANGARAKVLSVRKKDADDLDRLSYTHEAEEILEDRDNAIDYLLSEKLGTLYQLREAELAFEKEWSEENYLQGLRDAWEDGLSDAYAIDQEDEDALRVFNELKRFAEAVEKSVQGERDSLAKGLENKTDEELEQLVVNKVIEAAADLEWLKEFRKSEIFFAVREPGDHNKPYFEKREDIDDLEIEVFGQLTQAYNSMRVDVVEGKDSPETPDS